MKTILKFLVICLALNPWPAYAQDNPLNAKTVEICNQVMLDIYYDLLDLKAKYPDLAGLNETHIYENTFGLYTIVYRHGSEQAGRKDPRRKPYAIGLTFEPLNQNIFSTRENVFHFEFPLLNLKMSGYQNEFLLRRQLNIVPLLRKHLFVVSDYQQEFMPLRLILRPTKAVYHIKEPIEFEVMLKNASKRHMYVKPLGLNSLTFIIEDRQWGVSVSEKVAGGGKEVLLKSGSSLRRRFWGDSFRTPRSVDIRGYYTLSIDGVSPSSALKIEIQESPEK